MPISAEQLHSYWLTNIKGHGPDGLSDPFKLLTHASYLNIDQAILKNFSDAAFQQEAAQAQAAAKAAKENQPAPPKAG
jgi:hypothetical protein